MPRYSYECNSCKFEFEDYHLMSEPHPKKCPECGRKSLSQSFTHHTITPLVYGNPTTIGQAAEANTKRLGKERHQKMVEADHAERKLRSPTEKVPLPWYRDGSTPGLPRMEKPLDTSKIKDIKKFVETGETR